MKIVAEAKDLAEAGFLVSILASERIEAEILDEHAFSMGLPVRVAVVRDEDFDRAMAIIHVAKAKPIRSKTGRSRNPRNFLIYFLLFIAGFAACYLYIALSGNYIPLPATEMNTDNNFDGQVDAWFEYDSEGLLKKGEYDQDYDGKTDMISHFKGGYLTLRQFDSNFDGQFDTKEYYNKEYLRKAVYDVNHDGNDDEVREYFDTLTSPYTFNEESDCDFDGIYETYSFYKDNYLQRQQTSFRNDSILDRLVLFEKNRKKTVIYDRDRDGVWDDTINYDVFEKEIKR
ncbi:MAG: DUF2007 domain-containing protein [Bacteroidota bacterium]